MNMDMSSTRVGVKCGRWNPTAEQVKVLTDLFSSGLRTPTTEQIQMISTHLNTFGKIESKNVFYWFQNHKARERHHKKRRRGSVGNGDEAICNMIRAPEKKEPKFCAKLLEQQAIREAKDQSRRVETLELFPLSSYSYEGEKWQKVSNEWREIPFMFEADIVNKEPPLDLRLSFL